MPQYRYRPRDNRTPVHHHLFGGLAWDQLIEWPEEITDPDFQEVEPEKAKDPEPGDDVVAGDPEPQATKAADAGKSGRSKE